MAAPAPPPRAAGQRLIAAAELARFETCPLAWWYDRAHPLAQASGAEIARRLAVLAAVYGPGAPALPEYQLLSDLAARVAAELPAEPEPAALHPAGAPRLLILAVLGGAAIIVGLALAALAFAVWSP